MINFKYDFFLNLFELEDKLVESRVNLLSQVRFNSYNKSLNYNIFEIL
jgi:hypothetical protein